MAEGSTEPEKVCSKAQGLEVDSCGYSVGAMKEYMCLQRHGEEA